MKGGQLLTINSIIMSTVESLQIVLDAIANGDEVTINIKGYGYNHTIKYDEGMVKDVL